MRSSERVVAGKEAHEQRAVRDAYGVSLALVLGSALLLIASGAPIDSWLAISAAILQVAALVLTLRVSGVGNRKTFLGSALGVFVLGAAVLAASTGVGTGRAIAITALLLLALSTMVAVIGRIRTYRYVSLQSVLGLLVIYVLLGVSFGLAYLLIDVVAPPAFAQGSQGVSGAMYMSFITLATVGYGDVSPGGDVVRALAVGESIIGQLYLVSVVSLAVSRLGVQRSDAHSSRLRAAAAVDVAPLEDGGSSDV